MFCFLQNTYAEDNIQELDCTESDFTHFSIGTGKKNGGYYNFAVKMNEFLKKDCIILDVEESNGSSDNIKKLKGDMIELAIIQSDVSYKSYKNKGDNVPYFSGFSTILPLFNEYIQLITIRDEKNPNQDRPWLGDLINQPVSLGKKDSGTAVNAKEVLDEAKVIGKNIDEELCDSLFNKTAIAGFTTSKNISHCQGKIIKVEHVFIPMPILEKIAKEKNYYSITKLIFNEKKHSFLTVKSYFVIRDNIDKNKYSKIKILIGNLTENWNLLDKNILPLDKSLNKNIVPPIHDVSKEVLLEGKYAVDPSKEYWYLFIWFALSIAIFMFNKDSGTYNRLGHQKYKRSPGDIIYNLFSKFGNVIQIASVLLILLSISTISIQLAEQYHSPDSSFTNMSMWNLMIWAFTFMASGFTSNLYPSSGLGQIFVAVLASVGLFGPFFIIFKLIDKLKENHNNKRRGGAGIKLDGHVLICGWNEKVPRILYSLTCNDAPEKKNVVVIAELDEEYPLDKYDFNRQYVSYYRDDSANIDALLNVSADKASMALVVAGDKKRGSKNITSVLTGLSLKKVNKDMFIASELAFSHNREYFESAGVDVIIDFNIISNRLIVLSSISSDICDFLLDMLTYDSFSEIYSIEIEKIHNYKFKKHSEIAKDFINTEHKKYRVDVFNGFTSKDKTIETINSLLLNGVNVIGYSNNGMRTKGVLKSIFEKGSTTFPMIDVDFIQSNIGMGGSLVYLADEKHDMLFSKTNAKLQPRLCDDLLSLAKPKIKSVLVLAGSNERRANIESLYASLNFDVKVVYFTGFIDSDGLIVKSSILEKIDKVSPDYIIILSPPAEKRVEPLNYDRGESDARSIIISKMIRNNKKYNNITISSELVNINNKSMLIAAGVNVVIPESLFVERMLTKLVYNHGAVIDFFVALLNVGDSKYLYIVDAKEGDSFINCNYAELWATFFKGGRLIACLPKKDRARLKTEEEDFASHYITSPQNLTDTRVEHGDKLVFMLDGGKVEWLSS